MPWLRGYAAMWSRDQSVQVAVEAAVEVEPTLARM
jgi:hypothetical protein